MTKKKTILLVSALVMLVLILIGGIYSCQNGVRRKQFSNIGGTDTVTKQTSQKNKNPNTKTGMQENETVLNAVTQTENTAVKDSKKMENPTINADKTEESNTNKSVHTHKWKLHTETVVHEEEGHFEKVLVKEAWVEEIPKYKYVPIPVCNLCRQEIVGERPSEHGEKHALAGEGGGGHHTVDKEVPDGVEKVTHPAEYQDKWVVDKKAYSEKKNSYRCECGATRK